MKLWFCWPVYEHNLTYYRVEVVIYRRCPLEICTIWPHWIIMGLLVISQGADFHTLRGRKQRRILKDVNLKVVKRRVSEGINLTKVSHAGIWFAESLHVLAGHLRSQWRTAVLPSKLAPNMRVIPEKLSLLLFLTIFSPLYNFFQNNGEQKIQM